jgi:hypothetical protein
MQNLAAAADVRPTFLAGPVRRLGSLLRVGSSTVSFSNLAALNEEDVPAGETQADGFVAESAPAPAPAAAPAADNNAVAPVAS